MSRNPAFETPSRAPPGAHPLSPPRAAVRSPVGLQVPHDDARVFCGCEFFSSGGVAGVQGRRWQK